MYTIEFYSNADDVSKLWDFLDDLQKKAATNKNARIQHKLTDSGLLKCHPHPQSGFNGSGVTVTNVGS